MMSTVEAGFACHKIKICTGDGQVTFMMWIGCEMVIDVLFSIFILKNGNSTDRKQR